MRDTARVVPPDMKAPDLRASLITLLVLLTVLPLIRVASTYHVFSETADEPVHLAAGFQRLTSDRYDLDPEHPPLARIGLLSSPS